jgi:hypothetical protein
LWSSFDRRGYWIRPEIASLYCLQASVFSYNNPNVIPYNNLLMKQKLSGLLIFVLAFAGAAGAAEGTEEDPLFRDDAVLKAVLTAPIAQAYAQRDQDVRIVLPGQ